MEDLWSLLKYSFLGLLQGFTEPIPISSSGHVVLAQDLLGLDIEGLSFETLVNFASLLAVLLIYKRDLVQLTMGFFGYIRTRNTELKGDFMFVIYLLIATIPAAVIGLLLNDFISEQLKGVKVIGITLLVTGIALWLIRNLKGKKQDHDLRLSDAVIVGFAQAVALIPGISRSGATIVAAMGRGMKQSTALKFSFFLYIPVSLGGMVLEGSELASDPMMSELWLPYLLAFGFSLAASYYSLRWFMGMMQKGNLKAFAYYCFVVGALVLLFM
ncbi:undecaprenyl-diphosphate phosphatase [Marinicrinis lubricantis]|uniref:Undecaprenyl-diphosphatase n=1 Tax=Marinicrinis lubricantis TaxID=2086470 RepID=A0ABW1IUV9_9BACL